MSSPIAICTHSVHLLQDSNSLLVNRHLVSPQVNAHIQAADHHQVQISNGVLADDVLVQNTVVIAVVLALKQPVVQLVVTDSKHVVHDAEFNKGVE
jgi:hypothetical protein